MDQPENNYMYNLTADLKNKLIKRKVIRLLNLRKECYINAIWIWCLKHILAKFVIKTVFSYNLEAGELKIFQQI